MSGDLHIKPEMSDGFINVHEMILKARMERLKAQAYSDLEEMAWASAALAWTRALPLDKDMTDIDRLISACAEDITLARSYRTKKEKAMEAQEGFENAADDTPPEEAWTDETIKEFHLKFGKNALMADLATRRLLSLVGERDVIRKMKLDEAAGVIARLESEMADILGELETLQQGATNHEN